MRPATSAASRAAAVVTPLIAAVLGLLHLLGIVIAVVCWALPRLGVRWLDELVLWVRGLFWARHEGQFHSFGGAPLHIEDDGPGLMRVLGRRQPEAALAARRHDAR